MAISNNPFKDLNINRNAMEGVVTDLGAENYSYVKTGNNFQMSFHLEGISYKLAVYENKNGTTTLSRLNMPPDVFSRVAQALRDGCSISAGGRFDVVIPQFKLKSLSELLEFLEEEEVEKSSDQNEHGYRILRLKGTQGDVLTLKYFDNGTLHMQGRRAMLAATVLSFLAEVLNHDQAIKAQLDTFSVKVNLGEIGKEVEGRLPLSFKRVSAVVRTQLITALALSKLDMELPDYSPVAFPALRGLEGFLKTELAAAGLNPGVNSTFGDYFEKSGYGHQMLDIPRQHVGEPVATMLCSCYTVYSNTRHAIAHLGTDIHNSRTLPDLTTARTIVGKVFTSIEDFCSKLP